MSEAKPYVGYPYAVINPADPNSPLTVDRTTGDMVQRSFCATRTCGRAVYRFQYEPVGRLCRSCLREFGGSASPSAAGSRGFRPVTP